MIAKLSIALLATGALFMSVSGMGLTCFNGRWYSSHWVQEWTRAYGTDNQKAADCAVTSTFFGCICCMLSIAGYVLMIMDINKLFTLIAYAAAAGCALVTIIPVGIIVADCGVFDERISEFSESESFYIPLIKRTFVNDSQTFNTWFMNFWKQQVAVGDGKDVRTVGYALQRMGGDGFVHPISYFWSESEKSFLPCMTESTPMVFDCIVDFREGRTVYEYNPYEQSRAVCDTLKATVVGECFSHWNEKRLTAYMKEACEVQYDLVEGRMEMSSSPEAWKAYNDKAEKRVSKEMMEEGLATLYVSNVVFLGLLICGLLMAVGGTVLNFFFSESGTGVNDTKLIPE